MFVQIFAPNNHSTFTQAPAVLTPALTHIHSASLFAASELHLQPQGSSCQVSDHSFPKMINEKVMLTFRLIFHKTSQLQIVPFAYHPNTHLWSIRASKPGLLVSVLSMAILCFRFTFVVIALGTSDLNPENLREDCLRALQLIVFFNGCGFTSLSL